MLKKVSDIEGGDRRVKKRGYQEEKRPGDPEDEEKNRLTKVANGVTSNGHIDARIRRGGDEKMEGRDGWM